MKIFVFILFYIIFLYNDIKKKYISRNLLILYFLLGILLNILYYKSFSVDRLIDIIYSMLFGTVIIILSIVSSESIGKGDGIYFFINGLYISFRENIILFMVGIITAFIISMFISISLFIFKSSKSIYKKSMPFFPFLIPAIIMEAYLCIR